MIRTRLAAILVALAALFTIGASAAHASAPASAGNGEKPWLCLGERDVDLGVCLYSPVPPPPGAQAAAQ